MQSTQQLSKSADEFINELKLIPHPYGCGYFLETDREPAKTQIVKGNNETVERNLSTCIIALFKGGQINPLHRTNSTQIIHYYPGGNSSLLVHIIDKNGKLKTFKMPEETFQLKILSKTWFAFELANKTDNAFVVTGHTVSPGFDLKDFELGNRNVLSFEFPHLSDFIGRFTLSPPNSASLPKSAQTSIKDSTIIVENKCKR